MKLDELVTLDNFQNYKHPKNAREIALEQRLAYAKELLKDGPDYINRHWDKEVKEIIEKLNAEGL